METTAQLCTFYLDDMLFGVDVLNVQEVVRAQPLTRVPLALLAVRGLLNLRGQIVPALDLRCRLGLADRPDIVPMNVVLRGADGPVSLLVDRAGDVLTVNGADFEPSPETLRGPAAELVCGAYKLDNRLLLVLDGERVADVGGTPANQH